MTTEISDLHRQRFQALAEGWIHIGASCVQLFRGDEVLIGFPDSKTWQEAFLSVPPHGSGLGLRVYGLTDTRWIPTAESMLDVFASLLTADSELDDLTAALVETQDRLVALYELTQATRRTLDVPILLDLLLQQSKHLLNVDGGFVILKEKGKQSIIHQVTEAPLHPAHVEAAVTLFLRDPNRHIFRESETLPAGLQNVMMVTLPVRDEVSAAVGLFNKTGNFTMPDIKLAKAIAGHIGAQLENAMLHKESLERARLETEMDIARQVQTAILPQSLPRVDGLDIFAVSIPAFEVGGDFFDVIDRSRESLIFAVGDVTGKGMPAALLMSMTHTVIKSASRKMPFTHPHQVLDRLNHDLFDDFSNVGMFTTVFVGQLNNSDCTLTYTNAGHSPIFHLPANSDPVLLEAQDVPVGVLDDYQYSSQSLCLFPGDVFVVASDGFPESRNPPGEMFGYERMKDSLTRAQFLPAKEMAAQLIADVQAFCGSHPQDDDRTIVVIKVGNKGKNYPMQSETLEVHADYKEIRYPSARLRGLLEKNLIQGEIIDQCELALQELLTNLVDHAYNGDTSRTITVTLTCLPTRVLIETQDTGIPARIDLKKTSMPKPEDLAEGGYGMAIIQSLMDEVSYWTDEGRNTWRLVRNF